MRSLQTQLLPLFVAVLVPFIANCGGGGSSFSLVADSDEFQQSAGSINDKVDILWVIDSSGSMDSSQQNLTSNFSAFIQDFQTKNLDFKMAVTGTDAYKTLFGNNTVCSQFRDGPVRINPTTGLCQNVNTHNGIRVMVPSTLNLASVFINNISQGISGGGDERSLQSMRTALDESLNTGFLRPDSFLAIIFLTDEDDFSHDGSNNIQGVAYTDSRLHLVSDYVTYLDTITGTSGATRRYSANSIAIQDTTCLNLLNQTFTGRMIAQRVNDLADQTGGMKSSLCGNFATELSNLADGILTLATQFRLSRIPIESSIVVKVNGSLVPNRNSNPGPLVGGWDYDSASNSIRLYGDYIPAAGSSIQVDFDPVAYGS